MTSQLLPLVDDVEWEILPYVDVICSSRLIHINVFKHLKLDSEILPFYFLNFQHSVLVYYHSYIWGNLEN